MRIFNLFTKKYKYKITCGKCNHQWQTNKPPKNDLYANPTKCPQCSYIGGIVEPGEKHWLNKK